MTCASPRKPVSEDCPPPSGKNAVLSRIASYPPSQLSQLKHLQKTARYMRFRNIAFLSFYFPFFDLLNKCVFLLSKCVFLIDLFSISLVKILVEKIPRIFTDLGYRRGRYMLTKHTKIKLMGKQRGGAA